MTIQLPASALPLKADTSPLASYLSDVCSGRKSAGVDLIPSVIEGAMALATTHPFDVNDAVHIKHHDDPEHRVSLLDGVLMLYPFARRGSDRRVWPKTVEEFGPSLLTTESPYDKHHRRANVEWFAALLAAAGCNPWSSPFEPAHERVLPSAVATAMQLGLGGLLERFLTCPGAWSAQQVADARAGTDATHWPSLVSQPHLVTVLAVLLEQGARLEDPKLWTKVMEVASPEGAQLLGRHSPVVLSDTQEKKIQSAWSTRLKAKELTPANFEAMGQALHGDNVSQAFDSIAAQITQRLSETWGKAPNGSARRAYDFANDLGTASLAARRPLRGGLMAGQWSLLAACAAERIRAADEGGALGWSVSRMLKSEFDKTKKVWELADTSSREFKGKLAPALGFDWRPGIAIDGIVALSLLGQAGAGTAQETVQVKQARESDVFREWGDFSQATGVEDVRAWARQHAPSAIAFTTQMLKTPHQNVVGCLLRTWNAALAAEPLLLQDTTHEERTDLLTALHGKFEVAIGGWNDATQQCFAKVAQTITGGLTVNSLTSLAFDKQACSSNELQHAVELALVPAPIQPRTIKSIMESADDLTPATLRRIEWRCKAQLKSALPPGDVGELLSFARSRRLERVFEGSGQVGSATAPRL